MTRRQTTLRALATFAAISASLVAGRAVNAQGTVSAQGFGYPPGQMSTRALGTGGAVAEFDSRSPLNPAALAIQTTGIEVYGQYDPEYKSVEGPSGSSHTTTARFPNMGLIFPMGHRWVLGLSASTFLDRTWATTNRTKEFVDPDTVFLNNRLRSTGGISDLRVGMAYAFNSRLRVGFAGHYFSGQNMVSLFQQFDDSLRYSNITQNTTLTFSGTAFSAGAEADLPGGFNVAASGRRGRQIQMSSHDTLIATATIPDHYAFSLGYSGLPGTFFAVRYGIDKWGSLNGLSVTGATAPGSAGDLSVGVESVGPRAGTQSVVFRLGARFRTLPFQVSGSNVKERSFGGGVGIPIGQGRAMLDLSLQHSARTGVSDVSEHAYNLSFGLRVRP